MRRHFLIFCLILLPLASCDNSKPAAQAPPPKQSGSVLRQVTLEKFDEQGRPLWQVQAQEVNYSPDRKTAAIIKPKGNLFQNGQVVLQVEAERGQITNDGRQISLEGKITALDPRNKAVIRGENLEWLPQQALLTIQDNLVANNDTAEVNAKTGRYFTQEQRLELQGAVRVRVKEPAVRLQGRFLQWSIAQEKMMSDRRLQMERYQDQQLLQQIEADQGEYNLKTKVAILQKNIQIKSLEPEAQAVSEQITWNVEEQTILSPFTIKIVQQQLTVTGNQGILNLKSNLANLTGGIQAISAANQSVLFANQLQWNLDNQQVQATGNVTYQQPQPSLKVTGSQANGNLNNNTVVVTSPERGQVVTEIIME